MALTLPDLDPQENLDFSVDFSDLLPAGSSLLTATVETVAAAPDASPLADLGLLSPGVFLTTTNMPSPTPSPEPLDTVVFWLDGANGVLGTKYTLKVIATDTNTPPRIFVRRVTVKIKEK